MWLVCLCSDSAFVRCVGGVTLSRSRQISAFSLVCAQAVAGCEEALRRAGGSEGRLKVLTQEAADVRQRLEVMTWPAHVSPCCMHTLSARAGRVHACAQ